MTGEVRRTTTAEELATAGEDLGVAEEFRGSGQRDPTVAQEWIEEAGRRDRAMDRDGEVGTPADEVFRRLERRGR